MRFSILIPVYNAECYLKDCLESLTKQNFGDYEVILIDDGSTDKSGIICDNYALRDSRYVVVHQKNRGVYYSRKLAFSMASGEYCLMIDSDDFVDCFMLEKINQCINQFSPDIVLYDAYKYSTGHSYSHKPFLYKHSNLFSEGNKKEIYVKLLKREMSNALWSKVIKRSLVDDMRNDEYSDVNLGDDLLLSLPLLTKAKSIYYLRERLYFYRTNLSSLTHVFFSSHMDSLDRVNMELDKYVQMWNCENGESLAGFRYLVDIYDIFCGAVRTREKVQVLNVFERYSKSKYFQLKYSVADKQKLKLRQRCVVYALYTKNMPMLKIMGTVLLVTPAFKRILIGACSVFRGKWH